MLKIEMKKARRSPEKPRLVWWWRVTRNGEKIEGSQNLGWEDEKGHAYQKAVKRLRALKAQAVAER